jgi:alkylation response protein AidB-like acyl-CoA dehydrogenase
MPIYNAPQEEYQFIVNRFLHLERFACIPGYEDASPETLNTFLDGAARICESVAQPLNQSGDREGCRWHDGAVTTPTGFKEAYRQFVDGGWVGLGFATENGGKGLPGVFAEIFSEMLCSANMAFSGYIELSEAVLAAVCAHGNAAQKSLYLPKLGSGEWTGAMHLTEAHAGSDLRLLKTRAVPQPDGSYRIYGSKSFITNAEHDLAENIVHLVLARIPGSPAGSGGLSLFIVPKFLPDDDGSLGARNAVECVSIEHKMGLRAAPTGVINYDGAVGTLVGEVNQGLRAMFTTVNDARLGVAIQGLGQAEVAYQNAAHYAKERQQGYPIVRGVRGDAQTVAIAAHPDVRRMLLTMRAFTESARGLALWIALQIDVADAHPDSRERAKAESLIALLTPVIKAHFTDWGSEVANQALQCFGGYGYVQETGVEQFVRDVRVTQIYEGTNGIQALELVRRKLTLDDGRGVTEFFGILSSSIATASADDTLLPLAQALDRAFSDLRTATAWMRERLGNGLLEPAAGATDYLRLFGVVALGWIWLEYATLATHAIEEEGVGRAFFEQKLVVARFYVRRILPETQLLLHRAQLGSADLMVLADEDL